jgi:hypothetical protein
MEGAGHHRGERGALETARHRITGVMTLARDGYRGSGARRGG